MKLYRPVGLAELALNFDSEMRAFPPRHCWNVSLAPLRGAFPFPPWTGGVVALCASQPPANFCETSGLGTAVQLGNPPALNIKDVTLDGFQIDHTNGSKTRDGRRFRFATKSFGAVRTLEGVPFDLRAGPPGEPGGLPDISRGLSAATPPEPVRITTGTPERCQIRSTSTPRTHCDESLAPLRGAFPFRRIPGVSPRCARLNPRLISARPPVSCRRAV